MSEPTRKPQNGQQRAPVPTNGTAHAQQAAPNTQRLIQKEQVARVLKETDLELSRASRMLGLSEPQLILAIRQLFSPGI